MSDLTDDLRRCATEIAQAGHAGWGNACAGAADELDRLRTRVEELEKEREDFYMAYRMKCDAETKALHAENARLRAALEEGQ